MNAIDILLISLFSELFLIQFVDCQLNQTTLGIDYYEPIFTYNSSTNGLYYETITLTARMWPPIEAGSPLTIWGLPVVIWFIILGFLVLVFLILLTISICYWLPRKNKLSSPTNFSTNTVPRLETIMSRRASVVAKPWNDSCCIIIPMPNGLVPPQYSAPPAPPLQQSIEQIPSTPNEIKYTIPDAHKSMWAINPMYASDTISCGSSDTAYKSRSLPSWGKSKPRPVSNADNFEELYAKVNFSRKPRNRMRNDEAAIIALCRSRSQNLQGLPLEREGVVIYDERTAL